MGTNTVPEEEAVSNPPYKSENVSIDSSTMSVSAHDLAWVFKFWNINYIPPHKLRTFSRSVATIWNPKDC